jgi:hypothetical protein
MTNNKPKRQLYPVPDACEILGGICPRTLWGLSSPRGPIPSIRIGRRVLYSAEALQKWIQSQQAV